MTATSFAQANKLFKEGKLEEAIALYKKATTENNRFYCSYHNLGDALITAGRIEEAAAAFREALAINPKSTWSLYKLGKMLNELGQYEEAVGYLRQAVEQITDIPEFYLDLGTCLAKLGQWSEAEECLYKVVQFWPDSLPLNEQAKQVHGVSVMKFYVSEGYFYLGEIKSGQQQWSEAVEFYRQSWETNPGKLECCMAWVASLGKLGRWSEAVECFRQNRFLFGESGEFLFKFGQALGQLQKWDEAIVEYRKAINLGFPGSEVRHYLGYALGQLGRWEEAVVEYRLVVDINPKSAQVWHQLGYGLMKLERWGEAEIELRKAVELYPSSEVVKKHLADSLINLSNWEEAFALLDSKVEFNRRIHAEQNISVHKWEQYLELGDRLKLQGKFKEAILAYQEAIAENPSHSWSYHNLGDANLKLEQWEEAVAVYKKAIELNPDYFWSSYNLAVAYRKLGRWDQAINFYRRSIEIDPSANLPYFSLKEVLTERWFLLIEEGNALLKEGDRELANWIYEEAIFQYQQSAFVPYVNIPKEIPAKPSIIIIFNDNLSQCNRYRVEQKIEQLEYAGFSVTSVPYREMAKAKNMMHFHHVVIFFRVPAFPEVMDAVLYAKAINKVLFYEIDDLIFDPEQYPDPFESYGGQVDPEQYQGLVRGVMLFREIMSLFDYGIASTPSLLQEMEKVIAKEVFLHRNALDSNTSDFLQLALPKVKRDYISIFYGTGTKAHNADFDELAAPAIAQILKNYPLVRLTIVGYLTLPSILKAFEDRIDRVSPIGDIKVYWGFLRQADINIAVLYPTKNNNAKSELKWFEAAVLGVPSVVSPTQTYLEVVEPGVDVLVASNPEEWYSSLKLLITDEKLRNSIAKSAEEKVWKNYSVSIMAKSIKSIIMAGIDKAIEGGTLVPRTSKKKLLIACVFYPPQSIGGGTRIVRDNVDILQEKYQDKYEISVFTTNNDYPIPYEISEYSWQGIHVTKVSTPKKRGMNWEYQDGKMYRIFSDYLKFYQPDIIHFHSVQRLTGSILEAAADLQIPYLVTIHDAWWISDHQFLVNEDGVECNLQQNDPLVVIQDTDNVTESIRRRQYLRQRLNQASAVLAVSETFAELYRYNGFFQTKSNRNGIMPRTKLPRKPSASGRVRLAHIGGITAHKGYFLLKEAIELAKPSNIEVIVVNHNSMGTTYENWEETPVTFIPKIPQEKMPEFYSTVDVLMAPSIWPESYGLVTREAAAAGVWVVASNKGALAEDLMVGSNGDVFNPDNIEELVEILRRIDRDPERYQQLVSLNIPIRTTEEQVKELEEIYQSILLKYNSYIESDEYQLAEK
ncbi:MAG: tetratricopeptide repeat protein [Microcoleaceae cyanobacterium MO_207.B10]|nr:tetratricopeptide repeat protein [Microcoleaceae cyanobacterium MO_207.B10]